MSQPAPFDPKAMLAHPAATLSQILRAVDALEQSEAGFREASIGLSSNVVIELLDPFLRREALRHGVRLKVVVGNYDDPGGDAERFRTAGLEQMLLLPFFDNLLPAFEAQAAHLPVEALEAKEMEFRARYRLAFQRADDMKAVWLLGLHRLFPSVGPGQDRVQEVLSRFDQALREEAAPFPNIRWIEAEDCLSRIGRDRAFDLRFYFGAKAPYTPAFLGEVARRVAIGSRGFGSHFYKVLVLDCDNTLWGGVIGEDLLGGIQLGPYDQPGSIFWRVQHELVALEQSGVLLCLCSKNNPGDVAEVLARHPHAVLQERHFVLQKVNWTDKVDNLQAIAAELNLGLDSMVFLDDSPFECEAVRTRLPAVRTLQVPARLSDYPGLVQDLKELCLGGGISRESQSKTEQYRLRAQAEALKGDLQSQEDYLTSLGLQVTLDRNAPAQIPRLSELTLKSNQFNLTTRRYSEADIRRMVDDLSVTIYALSVRDRFGDSGLTGILIMRWEGPVAVVDSFLMSCRVLGRGIEKAVWAPMLQDARHRGCQELAAEFIPTPKNAQVASFFDELGLPAIEVAAEGTRRYRIGVEAFTPPSTPWIEVIDGQ
jgi:FkbH-like protein